MLAKRYEDFDGPENSDDERKYVMERFSKFLQSKGAPLPAVEKMEQFIIWCIVQCIFSDANEMEEPNVEKDHPALYADKKMIVDARKESLEFVKFLQSHQNTLFRTVRSKMKLKSALYNFHQSLQKTPLLERDETGLLLLKPAPTTTPVTLMPLNEDQTDLLLACHNVYFFGQYVCSILYEVVQEMPDIEDKSLIELWDELRGPAAKDLPIEKWTWNPRGSPFVNKIVQLRDALNATRHWTLSK